ncbi:hypothetical protein EST38_g5370 [Candolleomyces aberdarensis]|uniref:FAD dependent oxidoreductase domain-containing protein n=1 Tax=Candolleomyces aberdarensis TaxID=2316362 RepID=A0A4Q2DMP1_9AGAR|nr:hypothetical protein EST38_g5370 [Candolleomyces aberdarensis]
MGPTLRLRLIPHVLLLLVAQMASAVVPVLQFDTAQFVLESFGRDSDSLGLPFPHPARPVTLPVASPSKSFWLDSPGANPLAKVGSEGELTTDADVCIIGSGITGVSAAYHLARLLERKGGEANRTVVILEARDFCSGATGRNGGHLRPNPFSGFARRAALYGVEDAVKSYDLEEYTTQELLRIIRENGASEEVDLVSEGRVTLLMTPEEEESARVDFEAAKAAGLGRLDSVKWIDRETMNETRGTSFPGVWTPGSNLWPLKAVALLFKLAASTSEKVNVTLHTHTPVTSVEPSTDSMSKRRYALFTPRGAINCDYVVHATNGYANYLLDPAKSKVRVVPTRGQIILVPAIAGTEAVGKTGWAANEGFEYWFPRPVKDSDEERPLVVLGGAREAMAPGFEYYETDDGVVNRNIDSALRSFLPKMFPGLYDETSEPTWEWVRFSALP